MKYNSIPELFFAKALKYNSRVLLRYKTRSSLDEFENLSWTQVKDLILNLAQGLNKLGIVKGESVGLLSNTNHHWYYSDFAIMSLGARNIPLYHSSSADSVRYIVKHAQIKTLIVQDKIQLEKLRIEFNNLDALNYVIVMKDKGDIPENHPKIITIDEVIRIGKQEARKDPDLVLNLIKQVELDDIATIIYTSGTTGEPKGVPLTHRNLLVSALSFYQYVPLKDTYKVLSCLPLAHVFERVGGQFYGLDQGTTIVYCNDLLKIMDTINEANCNMALLVPRVLEKIHDKVMNKLSQAKEPMKSIISSGISQAVALTRKQYREGQLSQFELLQLKALQATLMKSIKKKISESLEIVIVGGAPFSEDLAYFFLALGINVIEGYGLTETSAPISVNPLWANKPGTVGIPFSHFEVKIADDKELLCKGPAVFSGYFNDPDATSKAIINGWFHTGDLGEISDDGYIKIIGRKKELLVTAGGKNIAPNKIEALVNQSEFISQTVVLGDREKYLAALIVPDFEALGTWARKEGINLDNFDSLNACDPLYEFLTLEVDKSCTSLATYEQIKKFAILDKEMSIDGGELTPTLKFKREFIRAKYADLVQELF